MIQVAPNRSQNGLIALAVLGIVGVLVLATYRPLPADPASTPAASEAPVASPTPSAAQTLAATQSARPTPRPTQPPCVLPSSLPANAVSAATPRVDGQAGSILFASPMYQTGAPAPIAADDPALTWNMGLWFVPGPGAAPRLITAAGPGMMIPLALAPSGELAAVWWWPQRRRASAAPCEQGVYAVNLSRSTSRLIARGDWAVPDVGTDFDWQDPTQKGSSSLRFALPEASFSADGELLAIVDGDVIDVYRTALPDDSVRHVGACPQWAWAAGNSRFVAGCEGMTSAWLAYTVCCDAGLETRSLPIAAPPIANEVGPGWELESNRAIGLTANGDIRVARTYGFATGCVGPGECEIPPASWAVTTIDWDTGTAIHGGAEVAFFFEDDARLSADASWLYGTMYGGDPARAVTVDLATGTIRQGDPIGTFAGATADGSTLYGVADLEGRAVTVRAATLRSTIDVVTISWPSGAVAQTDRIPVIGLWVAAAT